MLTPEYRKFYQGTSMTRRELRKLELIDRIRYMLKRVPEDMWTAKVIHQHLLNTGLITSYVTVRDIEHEMLFYYGFST